MRSTIPLFLFALAASAPALAAEVVPLPYFDSVELRGGGNIIMVPGPSCSLRKALDAAAALWTCRGIGSQVKSRASSKGESYA